MNEQITNIYERIVLDICREYLSENKEILNADRVLDPRNYHSQLAFFNPPNRLRCIQEAIYREVRICLAMDKTQPKRSHVYSVYGQRAKQDYIGRIINQEMYDEDDRWCNFRREEAEVLELIVKEMIDRNICETTKKVLIEESDEITMTNKIFRNETTEKEVLQAQKQTEEKNMLIGDNEPFAAETDRNIIDYNCDLLSIRSDETFVADDENDSNNTYVEHQHISSPERSNSTCY